MTGQKEVSEKKYPPDVNYRTVMKGLVRLDPFFHLLMAILLITGLMIDLLGPWLGGWLWSIRTIAHGYLGALFILVFIVYIAQVIYSKKMRTVLTATNYVDFLFYIILIITGITTASANKPWIDVIPGLFNALSPIASYTPAIHTAVTYVWIVFPTVFPGGILHGIASVYLISHLKKKSKMERS